MKLHGFQKWQCQAVYCGIKVIQRWFRMHQQSVGNGNIKLLHNTLCSFQEMAFSQAIFFGFWHMYFPVLNFQFLPCPWVLRPFACHLGQPMVWSILSQTDSIVSPECKQLHSRSSNDLYKTASEHGWREVQLPQGKANIMSKTLGRLMTSKCLGLCGVNLKLSGASTALSFDGPKRTESYKNVT